MCLSVFLAQVLGFYLFLVGLGLLINPQHYKKVFNETIASHSLLGFTGFVGMLVGLLVVTSHNVWEARWPLAITLVGWFLLLQGALRVVLPDFFVKLVKKIQSKTNGSLFAWIWVLVGLYLIWASFTQNCGY